MIIQLLIKAERWRSINVKQNIIVPLYSSIKISAIASVFGMVTPGRIGEFIKVRFVKNYSSTLIEAWIGVIIDRLFDLIFVIIVGMISTIYLSQVQYFKLSLFFGSIFILVFIIMVIMILKHNRIIKFFTQIKSTTLIPLIITKFDLFRVRFIFTFKNSFIKGFSFTCISFLTQCFTGLAVIHSLGFSLPLYILAIVISISTLVSLLPISIGGFGTRESIYIALLNQYGIPMESALVFSLINGVLISTIFVGLLAFGFWSTNRFSIDF